MHPLEPAAQAGWKSIVRSFAQDFAFTTIQSRRTRENYMVLVCVEALVAQSFEANQIEFICAEQAGVVEEEKLF